MVPCQNRPSSLNAKVSLVDLATYPNGASSLNTTVPIEDLAPCSDGASSLDATIPIDWLVGFFLGYLMPKPFS